MPTIILPPKNYANFLAVVARQDALVRVVDVEIVFGAAPYPPLTGSDSHYNGTRQVELEFEQLADPQHVRPILRTGNGGNRAQVSDLKTNIVVARPLVPAVPVTGQALIASNPPQTSYYDAMGNPIPRPIFMTRGADKNTIFAKKRPCDVLDTKFRFAPFKSEQIIGFCYDDARVHQKGDRYNWMRNAGTNSGFWIGGGASLSPYMSSATLKAIINSPGAPARVGLGNNSELLRSFSAESLTALFCLTTLPGDRLTLLAYYIKELTIHNPRRCAASLAFAIPVVPLVTLDSHGRYNEYDITEIGKDLHDVISAPGPVRTLRLNEICGYLGISLAGKAAHVLVPEILTGYTRLITPAMTIAPPAPVALPVAPAIPFLNAMDAVNALQMFEDVFTATFPVLGQSRWIPTHAVCGNTVSCRENAFFSTPLSMLNPRWAVHPAFPPLKSCPSTREPLDLFNAHDAEHLRQVFLAAIYLSGHIHVATQTFTPDISGEVTIFLQAMSPALINDYLTEGIVMLQGVMNGRLDLATQEATALQRYLLLAVVPLAGFALEFTAPTWLRAQVIPAVLPAPLVAPIAPPVVPAVPVVVPRPAPVVVPRPAPVVVPRPAPVVPAPIPVAIAPPPPTAVPPRLRNH